ncbi:MAG: Rpp14/Pop5 family protein [Archaeoglobaceae archaeon]
MKLPASMRSRKRYIAFRIISKNSIDRKVLWEAMMRNLISLFGEVEALDSGLKLEEFDGEKGIVSCKLESVEKVIISLTLIDNIAGENVALITLATSGTMKACKKKLEVVS